MPRHVSATATRPRYRAASVAVLLLADFAAPFAAPAHAAPARTETPVASSSPVTAVKESVVRVKVPLPASAGPHPSGCDWLSYLRFRHADGPAESARADRILIAQPGILEGAGAFDSVARNTLVQAAGQGRHIEFWALDRRSNCLEDHTGLRAGTAANDPRLAIDYYYRHRQVEGRTFSGFLDNAQVGWLAHVGLEQTVRDQYDLMTAELPSRSLRKQKVMCGGHSLGGVLTGFFSVRDFDGDHATTQDAGYNQCSGYFALDTTISTSLDDLSGTVPQDSLPAPGVGYAVVQTGLETGIVPRTVSGPAVLNAETMNMLGLAGLSAKAAPGAESDLVTYLPSNFDIEASSRVFFSKDLATFLTGTPGFRDFHLTNEAALGGLMDDNSAPLSFIQASVGFFDGGKITDKEFPLPGQAREDPSLAFLRGLFGREAMAIPDEPNGPLHTWRDYSRIGAPDDPVHRTKDGKPFTTPTKEVTAVQELARSLSEHPLDFTEQYFPTKIVSDIALSDAPQAGRDAVHPEGLTANPRITLLAGDGILADHIPEDLNPVIAPGYQHLDVLTAAPGQNGGRPEIVSTSLAGFVAGH